MERNRVSRAVPDLLSAFDEQKEGDRGTFVPLKTSKKKPNLMLAIDEEDEEEEEKDKIRPPPLTVKQMKK